MEIDIRARKIGLNFTAEGTVQLLIWAPYATNVSVLTGDRDLEKTMIKQEFGYWFLETDHLQAGDQYSIKFQNKDDDAHSEAYLIRADPASTYQRKGICNSSTAFDVTTFPWTDQSWKNIALNQYIIYELHVGTFSAEGDFLSVEKKLDYLVDLGITAIEIMPVAQFPGNRNWGYDGVFPFATQHTYGGPEALQRLINACHLKGLAVILDVVYNHVGPEGNYFNDFGPYFTDKYHTPWGSAINFDDAQCDPVRQYFIENVLMWLRDFHVDALRLDAVHAIKDFSAIHILAEMQQYVNRLTHFTKQKYHLIVELDLNDTKYINPLKIGGYGMNAQWIDEFHHALRVTAGQERNGYYEDFNGIYDLAKAYQDAYVYDGQYSAHREKRFGVKTSGNKGEQFIVFSQNHDQVGNRMLGERTSQLVSFEMLKLMAASVLISPFLPLLFMGEEYAEENPFQFFISHADHDLVEAVRKGRKAEFKAFHYDEETPDPQSEETFNRSKLNFDRLNQPKHALIHAFYKKLISLRKSIPALSNLDREHLKVEVLAKQNCLILQRWHLDQKIVCLLNFSNEPQKVDLPKGNGYSSLLNSAAEEWGGTFAEQSEAITTEININPESIRLFTCKNV